VIDLFWLIPLIPMVGVTINGLFGRRIKSEKVIALIACATILTSFVLSVGAVYELA
jgi:NADH-quinone oxidoreductase subunit L